VSEGSLLATRSLGLDIGGATIVADVSLGVSEGELLGIIGPNGAGKTSFFNLLSGIYRPTSGTIELDGRDITHERPYRRTRRGLGRTFQVSNVFPLLPVLENVRLAAEARLGGTMRIWRRASWMREAIERARWALERVGLAGRTQAQAGQLAHGDKRKLELAMLLAADPRVILLDEPMAGVNPTLAAQLLEHMQAVREERGVTFLLVEHDLDLVMRACDTVVVMNEGRILTAGTPDEVRLDQRVVDAYLGTHA
jgi:branched-chain amino acid transport system ATP-binding protein